MNNLKKIGLTALAGTLVSVSANAADLSVTGGASISFAGEEKQLTGNGWSMNNGVTFSASVEQDNGWNITATQILNDDDVASDRVFDTRSLGIDMGDAGTLTFYGPGGSGAVSAIDDTTPTAGEESWDDVTGADVAPSGPTGNNMFHYTKDMSNMMDGLSITASFTPSDKAVEIESSSDYAVKYTGIDGLTVGFGQGEDNGEGATASVETDVIYANFATEMGISVGYTASEADSNATNADKEMTAMGISYAMSEDMSVSYNISEIEFENSTLSDQEATGISVSYTMGSLSIKANHNTVDNIAGTSTDDRSGYALTLGFTF
jgi:outer membrane protein OmpU